MKKILNPKLNTAGVTMIDTSSSEENLESSTGKIKGKKPLKTVEGSILTQTKLSAVFLELRDEMLKEQKKEEVDASYSENKLLMDGNTPDETNNQEIPSFPGVSTKLLHEDEDIFRNLNIPWLPSEIQDTTTGKDFDSEKENLQRTIKQYKHQMDYMQETNDGLILANRRIQEDLQELNDHYQELTAVSKEALKRKRNSDLQCAKLKQAVRGLQ